jgi:hypothetical protein
MFFGIQTNFRLLGMTFGAFITIAALESDIFLYVLFIYILCSDLSQWVSGGFNASLITYGARGAGKTVALFGVDLDSPQHALQQAQLNQSHFGGIVPAILKRLYDENNVGIPAAVKVGAAGVGVAAGAGGRKAEVTTIAISAWSLCGQTIIDLLSSPSPNTSSSSSSSSKGAKYGREEPRGALEFASVECPSFHAAMQVSWLTS